MNTLVIKPRKVLSWEEFVEASTVCSIALDGMVSSGPRWNERLLRANFDHHSGCVREATMSTSKQVLFAIKGGIMDRMNGRASVWVNDPDQDTSFATWLLDHHRQFEGVQSHPVINRLLELTDRWDITGGAYPTALDDALIETHAWVFEPYTALRTSGALATADEGLMRSCFEAVHGRLNAAFLGSAKRKALRTDHEILYDSPLGYKLVNETGGNEARYHLFSRGMNAFISIVATRPDGRRVISIGRRSQYIDFPVPEILAALSKADDYDWGGSTTIGGPDREHGTGLSDEQIIRTVDTTIFACRLERDEKIKMAAGS